MKFEEETDAPIHVVPTNRSLPAHKLQANAAEGVARSAITQLEGPIRPGVTVTHRHERNSTGERYERVVSADLLIALDAIAEKGRGGDVVKVRTGQLDELWDRYDAGDYGSGKIGLGIYPDIKAPEDTTLTVWLIDQDLIKNPTRNPAETQGPQRLQIATPKRTPAEIAARKAAAEKRTSSRS